MITPGGNVLGVGCDLCEVSRLRGAWERQGERFLETIYTPEELAYCLAMREPAPHLAARFAAKEAASKAFGTGIGAELGWQSVSVGHGPHGEPVAILDARARELLAARGATGVLLSLTHTGDLAMAVALLVAGPERP